MLGFFWYKRGSNLSKKAENIDEGICLKFATLTVRSCPCINRDLKTEPITTKILSCEINLFFFGLRFRNRFFFHHRNQHTLWYGSF